MESRQQETRFCNEPVYRKVAYGPHDNQLLTECGEPIDVPFKEAKACMDCGRLEGEGHVMRSHTDNRQITYEPVKLPGPLCRAGHQLPQL